MAPYRMMGKRARLAAEIDAAIKTWSVTPFDWGRSDCMLSIADIIHAALGYDPAAEYRGRYKTKLGAFQVTRRFGGFAGALESCAIGSLWRVIDPREAIMGDVGIIASSAAARCCVIKHRRLWVGRAERFGFSAVPTAHIIKAWRVA